MPVTVFMRKGESVDKALRRLKKRMLRENIIGDVRDKRYFTPPCEKKRQRKKEQRFKDMLRCRRERE